MYKDKTILAVIPARGGSKGIPRKNIRQIMGKPLIAWTIEEAKKSRHIDRLIISTEDDEILKVAETFGCEAPFRRPAELARDDTPGIEPVLHALEMLPGYDYVVLLQPTSPLRSVEDIDGCIEKCIEHMVPACVTVMESGKSPYWMYFIEETGFMKPILELPVNCSRRQDLPKAYVLNGAVYVAECKWLFASRNFVTAETMAYIMPKERSVDVDEEKDLQLAEFIMSKR